MASKFRYDQVSLRMAYLVIYFEFHKLQVIKCRGQENQEQEASSFGLELELGRAMQESEIG